MGSDIANDEVEEPIGDRPATDGEEDVELTVPPTPAEDDHEPTRSEELTALREALEALQDVQRVTNDRIELLGREVDDIWMALRDGS